MFDPVTMNQLRQEIANEVVSQLAPALRECSPDQWLDAKRAAEYLSISVNALHKLTATDDIPYSQDVAGGKLFSLRSQLDAWRLANAHGPPV